MPKAGPLETHIARPGDFALSGDVYNFKCIASTKSASRIFLSINNDLFGRGLHHRP